MFSRSRNSQKPKKLHSLEYLKYLYSILQKNSTSTDYDSEQIVESLRLFSEILVWGDQNDGSIMDFFWEQNALELLIGYMQKNSDRSVCLQVLQTLNILFENLTNTRAIYYLLSQNHTNGIILHDFEFQDEEIIGYYIAFLKALSFRVNEDTVNFFYDEAEPSFPLYQRALRFFNHSETMVRIAVRTITLNIFKVHHVPCSFFVYAYTAVPYFSHLTDAIRRTASGLNECICFTNKISNRGRIEDLMAEQSDHLHYIDEIFSLGIPDLTSVLFLIILQRLLLPIYLYSLTKRNPPNHQEESRGYFFHAVSMFLLSQVFTILHQPDLIRVLTEAIFVGDLSLICCGSSSPTTGSTESSPPSVVAQLRAAHHGRIASKASPAGSRLAAFLSTAKECGVYPVKPTGMMAEESKCIGESLEQDIREATKAIKNFSSINTTQRSETIDIPITNSGASNSLGKPVLGTSPAIEIAREIAIQSPSSSPSCPPPAELSSNNSILAPTPPPLSSVVTDENGDQQFSTPTSSFLLTGKPFLRAIFRSLEVGPGTDYDTFFALSLLISIKLNGGQDEATLALAQINTPTAEVPCNAMLITKLLDIIHDASKPGSRVRVATLNLALFLLIIVTRDCSRNCLLTEHQRAQLQTAFLKSRTLLQDFYMTEPDFPDIFENEVCRFRAQKFAPSALLDNSAFLVCHLSEALKLNLSQEDIRKSYSPPPSRKKFISPQPVTEAYSLLPTTELEHIQRSIGVFFCLHSYLSTYIFYRDSARPNSGVSGLTTTMTTTSVSEMIPQNIVAQPDLANLPAFASFGNIPTPGKTIMTIGDPVKISNHMIFSCEIEHQSGRIEKRYLIVSDVQMFLVEPSPRRIGWGKVTFAGLLQDLELNMDSTDSHCLKIVVYKPGERSALVTNRIAMDVLTSGNSSSFTGRSSSLQKRPLLTIFPLMNAKLRFQTPIQCSTLCSIITHQFEHIRSAKHNRLRRLLCVTEKQSRTPSHPLSSLKSSFSANYIKEDDAASVAMRNRQQLLHDSSSEPDIAIPGKASAPSTLLQKANAVVMRQSAQLVESVVPATEPSKSSCGDAACEAAAANSSATSYGSSPLRSYSLAAKKPPTNTSPQDIAMVDLSPRNRDPLFNSNILPLLDMEIGMETIVD